MSIMFKVSPKWGEISPTLFIIVANGTPESISSGRIRHPVTIRDLVLVEEVAQAHRHG
jgi:hypothetical protein